MYKKKYTREEVERMMNEYFSEEKILLRTKERDIKEPKSMTGLALYMKTTRQTLYEWGKDPNLSDLIEYAKTLCENEVITHSLVNLYNTQMSTFILKNNHGYVDKQEILSDNVQKIEIIRSEIK